MTGDNFELENCVKIRLLVIVSMDALKRSTRVGSFFDRKFNSLIGRL